MTTAEYQKLYRQTHPDYRQKDSKQRNIRKLRKRIREMQNE